MNESQKAALEPETATMSIDAFLRLLERAETAERELAELRQRMRKVLDLADYRPTCRCG